jgi:hypothetical protein
MNDSFVRFVIQITIIAVVALILLTTWVQSAYHIGADCEKSGGFYIGDKVYKCELVK